MASFFSAFLRRPAEVGAIAPSSRSLARRMVGGMDLAHARCVVEYGPGTGAFTREILDRLGPDGQLVAIEKNPDFIPILHERFPNLDVVQASAEELPRLLAERGFDAADAIVSGLPYTVLPWDLVERIIAVSRECLCPGGLFNTVQYYNSYVLMPAARKFQRLLHATFDEITHYRTLWNLPPAFVYSCRKAARPPE
ncbi:MAG: methyltransferase domain-containing protein [Verrucomicrobia bacterium]|nr:methyltransferase domain-containing protein [Verrucomicrobiota bacterium]